MADRPFTHSRAEIAKALGIPTATMSGRVNALVKAGRVVESYSVVCGVTGNLVGGIRVAPPA